VLGLLMITKVLVVKIEQSVVNPLICCASRNCALTCEKKKKKTQELVVSLGRDQITGDRRASGENIARRSTEQDR